MSYAPMPRLGLHWSGPPVAFPSGALPSNLCVYNFGKTQLYPQARLQRSHSKALYTWRSHDENTEMMILCSKCSQKIVLALAAPQPPHPRLPPRNLRHFQASSPACSRLLLSSFCWVARLPRATNGIAWSLCRWTGSEREYDICALQPRGCLSWSSAITSLLFFVRSMAANGTFGARWVHQPPRGAELNLYEDHHLSLVGLHSGWSPQRRSLSRTVFHNRQHRCQCKRLLSAQPSPSHVQLPACVSGDGSDLLASTPKR